MRHTFNKKQEKKKKMSKWENVAATYFDPEE